MVSRFFALLILLLPLAASGQESNYTLGAGDVIRIYVYGEPDLTFEEVLVGESGKIAYPFLGEVRVEGVTLNELEERLVKGLKPDYLLNPRLSVNIVEYRPFFVSGEVKDPGSHAYQPGLKLRQAISLAGGLTERASESKIYVVHDNGEDDKRIRIDLNYQVRPGDTITVEQSFF